MAWRWELFVDLSRLCALLLFLYCSMSINLYSISFGVILIMTFYFLDRTATQHSDSKKATSVIIPTNIVTKYTENILNLVLYDVENCEALHHFEPVKANTHCVFAKASKLWGSRDYHPSLSLEHNTLRSVPAVIKFIAVSKHLKLDGFVFSLPGDEFGSDPDKFGEAVRTVLSILSATNPSGYDCMSKSFIASAGWMFELDSEPIFVTTFAPCYPSRHSRYAFGAKHALILLQPMHSFVTHDIGEDTPHTNWEKPQTVRDKIRVSYKRNDRPYLIRDTLRYPAVNDIVRGMDSMSDDILPWWKHH